MLVQVWGEIRVAGCGVAGPYMIERREQQELSTLHLLFTSLLFISRITSFLLLIMGADITAILPKHQVLTPADGQAYEDVIRRWADNAVRRAEYVVLPKSAQDVSKAVWQCLSSIAVRHTDEGPVFRSRSPWIIS